jgi:uncharacterized membrane protein YphA (DoxX/SURF4 family)
MHSSGYGLDMPLSHRLARSFIAPMFITGGLDAVRNPKSKANAVEKVAGQLSALGLPEDPVQLVRLNGAVQLAAGSLLAIGRVPRLASAALAASLVPTTLAGHRFWEETDPAVKANQRIQFLKNLAMLGGLLLAAMDTNGAPSLRWRAKKAAGKATASIGSMGSSIGGHAPHAGSFNEHVSALADGAGALGERAAVAVGPLLERVIELAGSAGGKAGDSATRFGEAVGARAVSLAHAI